MCMNYFHSLSPACCTILQEGVGNTVLFREIPTEDHVTPSVRHMFRLHFMLSSTSGGRGPRAWSKACAERRQRSRGPRSLMGCQQGMPKPPRTHLTLTAEIHHSSFGLANGTLFTPDP